MIWFLYPIIFIFGLGIGSFLNCVIYRLEKEKSFLKGRSYCPYCKQVLKWQDLIPVLSFLILKGKCRYCQKRISFQYPLVEIATGLLFLLIFYQIYDGLTVFIALQFLWLFVISCFLIIIFVSDLKHFIIPDKIVYPLIVITFLYALFKILVISHWSLEFEVLKLLIYPILSAIFASGFFLIIVLVSRGRGMGIGDIKLAFFMGLFLSFPNILVSLFFAFVIGAIIGIGLILMKKKTLKSEVPFGPFLIIGTFIAFFWGQALFNWYFNLIT